MNKLCYRLIFSRLHGELRVVAELARRGGASSGLRRGIGAPRLWVTVRRTVWMLGAALFAGAAVADGIVPDGNVAPDQRPEVIATRNGLPQVNITAPNQAGISHNQYQQFDVDPRGAILNNSAVMTSTQMAGIIQGNPNLNPHAAPAQVILNEVNSHHPSQLRGFMEVAGGQAQVIIANPAGIVCNGCGTINAGRMTLTTGKPQLNADGSLAGYQVERGVVRVEGEGLNATNPHDTRYVDILARAVKINAGVWAKERLSVIAGRNSVSADGNAVRPLVEDTSAKPLLAIDMGQMGGMYSGHIRMIGTEAGVGVRSRNGRLGGDKTLTVSCDGKLSWQSTAQEAVTQAGGDVILAARDAVTVHGKLHSGGQLSVQSREGALTQSGTLAAAGHVSLVAARGIKSRGHLLAGSDVDSHVVHEGNLTLASQGEIRASGRLLSKKDVIATGRGIDISGAKVAASRTTLIAHQDGVVMRQAKIDSAALAISAIGDIDAQRAQVLAGHWEVDANQLFNQKAVWSQTVRRRESRFTLAGKLDNSDGAIESRQLEFVAAALTNQRGRLVALDGEGQYWRVNGPLDNTGGALASGGNLTLKVGSLTNQDGAIKTQAALKIHTDGDINNAKGMLIADNAVELEALGTLDNQTGQITGGQMYLAASRLNNAQGEVVSQGRLGLTALRGLDNPGGWLEARGILSVYTHGEWDNRGGIVQGGSLAAAARALNNAGGRLQSRGDLTLDGIGDIINAAGILTAQQALTIKGAPSDLLDNDGGSLQSGGALTLQGGRLTNRQSGWVLSQQGLALDLAGSLDNQSGTVTGHGPTRVRAASLHNHQGVINALDTLDMAFTGALDNGGGRIFSKLSQTLQARDTVNRQGWVGSQGGWSAVSGGFDNAEGRLQSGEALMLDAQTLNNAGGTVDAQRLLALRIPGAPDDADVAMRGSGERQTAAAGIDNRRGVLNSGGGLDLAAAQLDNAGGTLISQGASSYRVGEFNNQQGKVHSADALTLDGTRVNNQGGQLVSTHALQIRANALDNSDEGILSSQAALEVQVGRLNNRNGGLILGSSRISITGRDLDNTAGRVQSAGPLTLVDVARLDNRRGHILANGALDIVTESSPADALLALLNQGGRLESDCALTLHARNLDNQGGTLLGRQALTLSAQQGYSHHADETISSNGTVTFSLSGAFHNLADWLLPGHLVLNAARVSNPAHLVAKTIQLTTGALQNNGRLEAGVLTLHADTLDNTAALMGDDIAVRGRIIDHHGQPAVMAATRNLTLHAGVRLSNREGALIYSGDRLSLRSDDVIENRASFIEADGDVTVDARRLDNLREGLVIGRDVEKNDYKWHRYNYYWRSYGSRVNRDKNTMTSTTQQLTFQDDNAAQTNRYGTLMAIDAAGKRALVRLKDRRGRMTDLWVNYLALQPNFDGSYAMRFYETRGFRQNGVPTPYHNTVWREHDRGRIEQWDPARHVDIDNAPFIRDYSNFRERTATGTVRRDVLINDGVGARLLAGGNVVLRITGQLLNDASVVTANGTLMQDGGGNVDNRGYSINARRQEFIVDHMDKDTVHWYPTHNLDETTALSTVDGVITGNGNVSINGARITHTTVNQAQISQREAALAAVDIERAEFERNPLAFTVNGVDVLTGDTPPAPGSQIRPTGLGLPSPLGRRLLPAERALTALQHLERVAMSIPNNSLFSQRLAPGSPFLVETDERFIRRDKFMSSDYLLNRVGYDPARVHKRLGDGFYEQRLVRMQMQALVGIPSRRGEEAMEQYQQLMNAGSKVAQDFNLVPGVALTPEQTAALQQDIVWLVSETVDTLDGPQTVWVPKVYLAPTTLRLTRDGAVIGGGNLQLAAGSVANAGNLFADKALTVETGHFRHQGGDIRAGSIQVQANSLTMITHLQDALRRAAMRAGDINLSGGDIHLHGAKLDATQNLSLSARHNLAILAAKSSHTAHLTLISGATGNRTFDGMEDAGARMARVSGEWQQALGSELNAGGNVSLAAGRDITAQGSQVTAAGAARVRAEGDINFKAATTTNNTHLKANSRTSSISSRRQEERLLLSTLSADKGVALVAGNHLLAEGAQIDSAAGRIGVSAQDVTIKDARARIADKSSEQKRQGLTISRRVMEINHEISTGSTFSGQQGVTIVGREGDITVTGSVLHSEQGAIGLRAKKDVILDSATERKSQYSVERSNSKGFLSKSSSLTVTTDCSIRERGALLSGERVTVTAGHDLTVKGSALAADRDISLQAGNNVDIIAATESETHFLLEEKKKSGLLGSGGIGFTLGSQSSRHQVDEKGTTQSLSVSTVGSSQGNVSITAGNRLYVGGADLVADKDLTLDGDSVTIDPGYDERSRTEIVASKQSGLSVALSGTAGSAFNTAVSSAQQARNESDSRLVALQRAKAALSGVQAAQGYARDNALSNAADVQNAAGLQSGAKDAARGANNTVGFTASYGSQSSRSESRTESRQSQGSTLTAGQSLSITAAGKNTIAGSGDIVVTGSALTAGMDLKLDAARDITLQSAQNIENTVGHNSSEGGHVGVGIGVGSGGYGISVAVGVNVGQGHEKGRGLTHTETTLDAGRRLSLSSGRDSTLKGAQARGDLITLDVGRDLLLQSAQDSDRYDAKQQDATAGGSFTFGSMTGSTYVSASQDKLQSHFDGVKAQTGLFAGAGGYNVQVQAHSQLDGAVIASQAGKGHNRLDTGTLGWRDIHNQAAFKAEHSGGSFSTGGPVGKDLLTNMAGGMLSGANNSRHDEGTTQSRISEGTLIIRDQGRQQQDVTQLKRETGPGNAGSISPLFDKEKEQSRLQQAQLIGNLGAQAMDLIRTQGDMAGLKTQKNPTALSQAREQLQRDGKPLSDAAVVQRAYNGAMAQYGTGSDLQKAAQAVTGALTALAGNNLAGALASGASPYLATEIKHLTTHPLTGKADVNANAMAHALLGALTAQLNHQSAVAGGLGAGVGELAARVIADRLLAGKTLEQLSASEKQQVSALSQLAAGLAGGLLTGDAGGAVTAAQTGKNAVENNYLNRDEASEKTSLTYKLQHGQLSGSEKGQAEARLEQLNETDKARDQAVKNICQSGSKGSVGCRALVGPAEKALKEYSSNVSYSLLYKDLYPQDAKNLEKVLRGLDTGALVRDQAITAIAKESGVCWEIAASRYDKAMVAQTIAATLGSVFAIKAIFLDGATTGTNQVNLPVKPHGFSTKMDSPVQKPTKTPPSIKSMQVGLREPQQIDQLKNDMLNGMYEFTAPKGRIAGWIDSKGNYYVSEGNHRMAAAQEIYKKTGDTSFIERLLENGLWTQSEDAPGGAKPMPSRK